MKQFRKILKVSFLAVAFAICLAILSACNGAQSSLPSEHFDGNCLTKGYTRYYMPNGSYVDREDDEFGEHSFGDGDIISARSCTQDGVAKFTCELCKAERFDVLEKFGHDYEEEILTEPTCTEAGSKHLTCKRCGENHDEDVDKLDHNYEETIIVQSTCTKKGVKSMTCRNCGTTATGEVDLLPHSPESAVYNDDEGHWQKCTVCLNTFGYSKHNNESKYFSATCVDRAYTHIQCHDCDYNITIKDEKSQYAKHQYEAYTCNVCQRDNLLDYINIFNSKGSDEKNLIEITSENMFVCFYDYLIVSQETSRKYIALTYTTVYEQDAYNFLANVRSKITATNWSVETVYSYNQITKEIHYFIMNSANSGQFVYDEVATYTPESYDAKVYEQYDSYQFADNSPRPDSFDNFAYKSRRNEMGVSSSDQLFYAFEHGYKPIAQNGSPAQLMLDKAKAVARRIMNDEMSDLQKVRAIYSYLVSDVAYDYGIVNMTNGNTPFAKCSSYYLEGVFNYGIAVCDGISKAFCVLAGLEDIKCVRVTSVNHAWNKVYIDVNGDGQKEWYGTDATWGNQSLAEGNGKYGEYLIVENFLFTDAQKTARGQNGRNYVDTNSTATDEENPFEYFYFSEEENDDCDFVITSDSELCALIDYMKISFDRFENGVNISVNFFLVSTYCTRDNINSKLSSILFKQWTAVYNKASFTESKTVFNYGGTEGYSVSIIISK